MNTGSPNFRKFYPREVDREKGSVLERFPSKTGETKRKSRSKPRRGGGGCGRGTYGVNALTSKWLAGTIIAHSTLRPHTHTRRRPSRQKGLLPGRGAREHPTETPYITFFRV